MRMPVFKNIMEDSNHNLLFKILITHTNDDI